jgi:hypothetical protein
LGRNRKRISFSHQRKMKENPRQKKFFNQIKLNPERFSISVGQEQKKNFFLFIKEK